MQQLRIDQARQLALQGGFVEPRHRAQQRIGNGAPDGCSKLGNCLDVRQTIQACGQRVLQRSRDGKRRQGRIQCIVVGMLTEQARLHHHAGELLHEQRHAVGLGHDLLHDFARQRLGHQQLDHAGGLAVSETVQRQRRDVRVRRPLRLERLSRGEQHEQTRARRLLDQQMEQDHGGRIHPVQVLHHYQQRLACGQREHQPEQSLLSALLLPLRTHRRERRALGRWQRQQRGEQRQSLARRQAVFAGKLLELLQPRGGRILDAVTQHLGQQVDDRVEGAVGVVGGAAELQARVRLVGDACRHGLDQAGLTDARIPGDQHHLALTVYHRLPAVQQQAELLVAPDQRREPAIRTGVQPSAHAALGVNPEHMDWLGEALQRVVARILGEEETLHQALAGRADHQAVFVGQPLQAGGQVRRLAQGELLAPLAASDCSHHHQAGVNADAHRQGDLQIGHQRCTQRADRLDDAEPRPHRPLGVVLMGLGMAEVDHQAIAEELGDMAFVAFDDGGAGGLISADDLAQILWIEPRGQRGRTCEVAEHDGDLPALAVGPGLSGRGVVGGPRLADHRAVRAGQYGEALATAAAEDVVWLVDEGAARAPDGQRLAAGRAKPAVGAVIDRAGGTLHGKARRQERPAGTGRGMVESLADPV